eukprot:g6105.t1
MQASLSLQLPHSDLSFVESDSDGEWSVKFLFLNKVVLFFRTGLNRRRTDPSSIRRHRRSSSGGGSPSLENRRGESSETRRFQQLRQIAQNSFGALCNSQVSDVGTKLLWLSVLHSAASNRALQFECSAVLCPWIVRFCTFLCRVNSNADDLPRTLPRIAEFLESCRIPAMISLAYQAMRWLFRNPPPPSTGPPILLMPGYSVGDELRQSIVGKNLPIESMQRAVRDQQPETAAQYAEIFKPLIVAFKETLNENQLSACQRLATRFDNSDTELLRYLLANNLLESRTDDEIERLFRLTSLRLQETFYWCDRFHFVNDRVIKRHWSELVCWTKRLESGHPVLLVRLGLAIRTCHGEKADEYGRAIISQVDRGVRRLLRTDLVVDTLVVIVDCEGASAANLNKIYGLIHGVPVQLNKHYPGRLQSMHIVNVPLVMRWLIHFIKKFLHPMTQKKMIVYGKNAESLSNELREITDWKSD